MEPIIIAYDKANQQLFAGDRVVYTTWNELEFGIITKVNPQKSTVSRTNSLFLEQDDHKSISPIDNRKIYKLNV
jgi:putative ribosome biogenesis GTPase RsgA